MRTMETESKDPVCGMDVGPETPHRMEHQGVRYLFCAAGCLRKFAAAPEQFIKPQEEKQASPPQKREEGRGKSWRDYIPLMVLVALSLLAAGAKQFSYPGEWQWMPWMHDFMGFFLIIFSMFKFFDLSGFADGFQMYDLLAKRFRPYAFVYPFLECGLGLAYLSMRNPQAVYIVTIILMGFGSLGVFAALSKKLDLQCACMGTVLKVPLSTVALVEDLGMVVMAVAMLVML